MLTAQGLRHTVKDFNTTLHMEHVYTYIYVCMYVCHAFSSLQFLCSLPKFKTLSHESVTKGVTAINEDVYSSLGILIQKKKKKIQGPELSCFCSGFQDWLQVGNRVKELFKKKKKTHGQFYPMSIKLFSCRY